MALYENIQYSPKGQLRNNSLMQYKVPTRLDMGKLRVEFESSNGNGGGAERRNVRSLADRVGEEPHRNTCFKVAN